MPDIITPQSEIKSEPTQPRFENPNSPIGELNPDKIQIFNYLDVQNILDPVANEKVDTILEYLKGSEKDLETIDLELGKPTGLDRIDKIYGFVLLENQEQELDYKKMLIQQAKQRL